MKKIISLIALFLLSLSFSFAAEPLEFDSQKINDEFKQLNQVEQYVNTHQGTTLETLKANNNEMASVVSASDSGIGEMLTASGGPIGIPSFWWGFVLGVCGLLVVYFVAKDRDQSRMAVIGCLISTAVSLVLYYLRYR